MPGPRDVIPRYLVSMMLVGAISGLALVWCYMNERHILEGPLLVSLGPHHGVHVFDLVVLGVEVVLITLLSVVLLAGFSRRR